MKTSTRDVLYWLAGLAIFIIGIVLLGWFTHWTAPLGVWLMIWGSDLGKDYG